MKIFFLIIGFVSMALGIIGIFLPVLPTTPFLLLSAVCFSKSSKKVDSWFKSTTFYEKYVLSYVSKKEMTKKAKIKLLTTITILMSIGMYFSPMIAKAIIVIVLVAHYYYFLFKVRTALD